MRKIKSIMLVGFKLLSILMLALFLIGCSFVLYLTVDALHNVPNWQPSDFQALPSMTTIYDCKNNPIANLRGKIYRLPVKLSQISPVMQDAIVSTEDERFYDHSGIDYWGLCRALVNDVRGSAQEGASTITQQLIKNVLLTPQKNISRKITEAYLAHSIEQVFSKRQILESYLNLIYFGEGAYGIQAASLTYFNKPASRLTLPESALLAGMPKNPYRFSPFTHPVEARQRRNTVLQVMYHNGYISYTELQKASAAPLPVHRYSPKDNYPYPYFLDYIIEQLVHKYGLTESQVYDGGLKVYTTLDQNIQQNIERAYADNSNFPPATNNELPQSAMVVLEQSTGSVRGLIGGRTHTSRRGFNRATMLKRQPGSTFKPLVVYAPAIERGYGPSTLLDTNTTVYGNNHDVYAPENMNNAYWGKISMRTAIEESVNTYAVRMLKIIGINEAYNFGKRLGLTCLNSQDKVLGLALGGITEGLSPLELASGYNALANRGVKVDTHAINKIVDARGSILVQVNPKREQVMKPESADLITDMLKSAVDEGTGKSAKLANHPVAGKTGTTELPLLPEFKQIKQGNKDAWFAGYTPEYVGVVWLGYDITDAKHYLKKIYGGTYPAKIWRSVFSNILAQAPPRQFHPAPANILAAERYQQISNAKLPAKTPSKRFSANSVQKANTPARTNNAETTAQTAGGTGSRDVPAANQAIGRTSPEKPTPNGIAAKIFSLFKQ